MKTLRLITSACLLAAAPLCPAPAAPQLINFQGRLLDGTNLVTGDVGLSLRIFNATDGGARLYEDSNTVSVVDGLYSTLIGDGTTFGSLSNALGTAAAYLEIMVDGAALSPRERIASAAYALHANLAQGVASGAITTAMIATGAVTGVAIAGGTITPANLNMASFSNTFWDLDGNAGTSPATHFIGTTDNQPLELRVNDSRALRIEPTIASPNVIGGHKTNAVSASSSGAVIGGGGSADFACQQYASGGYPAIGGGAGNKALGDGATVGGGFRNLAGDAHATVGGGATNAAGGRGSVVAGGQGNRASNICAAVGGGAYNLASNQYATIAGGFQNNAYGQYTTVGGGTMNGAMGDYAVVGGGRTNNAYGLYSVVAGGYGNSASGLCAVVAGGQECSAGGTNSFAAGYKAKALHHGSFVFADYNTISSVASTNVNSWTVRCTGGARFITAVDGAGNPTAGAQLSPGASAWGNLSDRGAKENFVPVDTRAVLEKVAAMPVTTWNLKAQDPSIRHVGPMAQDFRTAFGLGEDGRYINSSDADGVALAAIQGLYQLVREQRDEIAKLRGEVDSLRQKQAAR